VPILYHGTRRKFSDLDPAYSENDAEYGIFFGQSPAGAKEYALEDGVVLEVEVTFSNPYRCTAADWFDGVGPSPREVFEKGRFDAYIIEGMEDEDVVICWDPDRMRILNRLPANTIDDPPALSM
jgi:hypothetical protein